MKKIIILVLTLLLTACSDVSKTPLTAVKSLKIEKEKVCEIKDEFNFEEGMVNIYEIDDQYVYLQVWDMDENQYEFYKYNEKDKLQLMYVYTYEYNPSIDRSHTNTSCLRYNGDLIFTVCNGNKEHTDIFRIHNNQIEKIYNTNALIHQIEIKNDKLFFYESKEAEINGNVMTSEGYHKFLDLDKYGNEYAVYDEISLDINTGSLVGDSSSNVTFESDDGYIYLYNNELYFHEYKDGYDLKLFELDKELNNLNFYVGNENCVITYYEDKIHFIVKENDKYKDYYLLKEDIGFESNYFYGGYFDDQYYYVQFRDKNQFMIFDYINVELYIYQNDKYKEPGGFLMNNGDIYYISYSNDKTIIEKCTFTKV